MLHRGHGRAPKSLMVAIKVLQNLVSYFQQVGRKGDSLLRVIRCVCEKSREDPPAYAINTVNDHPIDICVEELGILDQYQPGRLENFSSAVREKWPRSSLPYCVLYLVLDPIRQLLSWRQGFGKGH